MAEIVNLRRVRKRLVREQAAEEAAAARAKHGRTLAERAQPARDQATLTRTLDGARLEPLERDRCT